MNDREINTIGCALVLRTREDPEILAAMSARFGFPLTRCDMPELQRIGGKRALVDFWQTLIVAGSPLEALATDLLAIHSQISPAPGVLTDAWTFAQALRAEAGAILKGADATTRELAAARLAVCRACPELKRAIAGSRCKLCNCFVRLKTKFRTEACPAGKWPG